MSQETNNLPDKITPGSVEKSWIEDALVYLATPKDKRYPATIVDFCEQHGIPRATFYFEIEKKSFQEKLLKRMLSAVKEHAPEVLDRLVQNAKEGETKAIEIFMKYVLEVAEKVEHKGEVGGFVLNIIQANHNEAGNMGSDAQAN